MLGVGLRVAQALKIFAMPFIFLKQHVSDLDLTCINVDGLIYSAIDFS